MLDRLTIERMRAWTGGKPVLLALSGGGDSVALLHLLAAELGMERLRAAVVDHALRDGSAADAARAASFAAELGVAAQVLTLDWAPGVNRAQQAAREARYRLLCDYARSEGLNTIAVAHSADDQAETVLMRAANGSTWRGLAGIASFAFAPVWPEGRGVALARPLLGVRRKVLRDHLRDRQVGWLEDPANTNPKFERIRIRERLGALEARGLGVSRLTMLASRLRRRVDALDRAALRLIQGAVELTDIALVRRAAWSGADEVRRRALSVLIAAVSGAQAEPPPGEIGALEERVMGVDHRGSTHSGVAFKTEAWGVCIQREGGAVLGRADGAPPLPPIELPVDVEAIWDGRFAVTAPAPGWRAVPARNRELVAFENGLVHKPYAEARAILNARSLVADRVRHAFAPDINLAKP